MSDRADWRTVLICRKNIFIIIMLIVMFLPQDCVYASDTEITDTIEQQMLEKIDMSDVEKYSKDYLPDRLSFSDIVDALLDADQKAGEKICEYIYELFFLRDSGSEAGYYKCAVLHDTFYGVFKAYFLAAGLCIQCKLSVYVCIGYINAYGIFFLCCLMWQRAVLMCF